MMEDGGVTDTQTLESVLRFEFLPAEGHPGLDHLLNSLYISSLKFKVEKRIWLSLGLNGIIEKTYKLLNEDFDDGTLKYLYLFLWRLIFYLCVYKCVYVNVCADVCVCRCVCVRMCVCYIHTCV